MAKYDHFKYGEALARSLKSVNHSDTKQKFYRATEQDELDELNARLSSANGTIIIAIDGSDSNFDWNDSDSLMEQPQYSFLIAKQTNTDRPETIHESQMDCKNIAMQIIVRMTQDHHNMQNGLTFLEINSFRMKGVGPIRDNFYGVLLGFALNQSIEFYIKNDEWEDWHGLN